VGNPHRGTGVPRREARGAGAPGGAYRNGLQLASEKGIKTLAFPSISTGAYGYPMAEGARIALTTAIEYLRGHPEITLVRFVLFGSAALRTYEQVLAELMPTAQRD